MFDFFDTLVEYLNSKLGITVVALVTVIGTIAGLLSLYPKRPHPLIQVTAPPPTRRFVAQLGHPNHTGFLPKEQRLLQIQLGQNPYCAGTALKYQHFRRTSNWQIVLAKSNLSSPRR